MPKMIGFELYRQLRKIDPGLHRCFFTAFDLYKGEFENMFPELKAKAFFRKPIRIDELAAKPHDLLLLRRTG
jgi:response regulator RpfG family c-di-GMP phosphodiesterase